ncbi:hypothetical protein [Bartonella sp. B39]
MDDYQWAMGNYTTAVDAISKALDSGATALGHRAWAGAHYSSVLGTFSKAKKKSILLLWVLLLKR